LRNRILYSCVIVLFSFALNAQSASIPVEHTSLQQYRGQLYCAGLKQNNSEVNFCVFQLNAELKIIDSLVIAIGKGVIESYLTISADTLHDFLNFYIQEKERKEIRILRLDKNLGILENIANVDVARLNNKAMFTDEKLYFENTVYCIRTSEDSLGKQFYLNKYDRKNESGNFQYSFVWQFPFEKKDIENAHILFATRSAVFLFVWRIIENAPTQWILKIHSGTGNLIRASKINAKGENDYYQFGNLHFDSQRKTILLCGQKITVSEAAMLLKKVPPKNASDAAIWICEIDSTGEIKYLNERKLPITQKIISGKKPNSFYILRINNIEKTKEGKIILDTDLYGKSATEACFKYTNSTFIGIQFVEEAYQFENLILERNSDIDFFYSSMDKLDMNAKLCNENNTNIEKIFYTELVYPARTMFTVNAENKKMYVLRKTDVRKKIVNYSFLKPEKSTYKISGIENVNATSNPIFIELSPVKFMIGKQTEGSFQMKLYNW